MEAYYYGRQSVLKDAAVDRLPVQQSHFCTKTLTLTLTFSPLTTYGRHPHACRKFKVKGQLVQSVTFRSNQMIRSTPSCHGTSCFLRNDVMIWTETLIRFIFFTCAVFIFVT